MLLLLVGSAGAYRVPSLAIQAHSPRAASRSPTPSLEAEEEPATSAPEPLAPEPLRPPPAPELEAAMAFGAAYSQAWSGDMSALRQVLDAGASVQTPAWSCSDRDAFESELAQASSFLAQCAPPSLQIISHKKLGERRALVSWMLGVEWPAAWRPRVNILGQTTLELASARGGGGLAVVGVSEEWHQSPLDAALSQLLPKLCDVLGLWSSPTAEHMPAWPAGKGDGYELRRLPPMLCLQCEYTEFGDLLFRDQAPLPPHYAFTGEVKRSEWYNTVTPGILERAAVQIELPGGMTQVGQRRRWIMPLPSRFGDSMDDLPDLSTSGVDEEPPECVTAQSVQHVRRPSQLLAVTRLRGPPSNEAVLSAAVSLARSAEAAGYRVVRSGGQPVLLQLTGEIKCGFNRRKELSMAVWLSVPGLLQTNEVAVVIDQS